MRLWLTNPQKHCPRKMLSSQPLPLTLNPQITRQQTRQQTRQLARQLTRQPIRQTSRTITRTPDIRTEAAAFSEEEVEIRDAVVVVAAEDAIGAADATNELLGHCCPLPSITRSDTNLL